MSTPLTELQKQLISKKLNNLFHDFPVVAIKLLCADGSEWKIGDFPATQEEQVVKRKPRHTSRLRCREGAVFGHLTDTMKPWIELALENPGEVIQLREEDTDGATLARCSGAFSSIVGIYMGPGHTRTWRSRDNKGDEVLFVQYTGPRIERHALNYTRKGVIVEAMYAKFLAQNAVTTASRSDATQEK